MIKIDKVLLISRIKSNQMTMITLAAFGCLYIYIMYVVRTTPPPLSSSRIEKK